MEKINRNRDGFTAFLTWLVSEKGYDANLIIQVVEKPWKWQVEYEGWLRINNTLNNIINAIADEGTF